MLAAARSQPGERVVDVACGTGMVTLPGGGGGRAGAARVLATDISQRMVDDVARRAAEHGLANVAARRCDAEDSARRSATDEFDVALCSLGLMYVPTPAVAVAEMLGRPATRRAGRRRRVG